MPCEYKIFHNCNVIIKRYSGQVTTRCVLELLDKIENDETFLEGMHEIDDLRFVTDFAIPECDAKRLAELIKCINDRRKTPVKRAVVAFSEDIRSTARLNCAKIAESVDVDLRIFSEMKKALEFMGILETPLADDLLQETLETVNFSTDFS